MEIIKKTINLEQYKSRTPALVPYIRVDGFGSKEITLAANKNGDLGGIMCDLKQLKQSSLTLFNKYYRIKNLMRGGSKYKRIIKGDNDIYYTDRIDEYVRGGEYAIKNADDFSVTSKGLLKQYHEDEDGMFADEAYIRVLPAKEYEEYKKLGGMNTISVVEDLIGLVRVPSTIEGCKVPETFYLSQVEPWIEWFDKNKGLKYIQITKAAYDSESIPEEKKGEFFGELPKPVLSIHPEYARVTKKRETEGGLEIYYKYYRRIDTDPTDCCILDEWNNRGGWDMRAFLLSKSGIYSQAIELWRQRIENGDVLVPSISIPILLTQDYDDNGVMSVYDDTIPYTGQIAGNGEPYTEGVGAESKLMSLRTRERLYGDDGNVLPYIAGGNIPFKVNECRNIAFDASKNQYIGDYIRKISYFDEEGNTSSTITDGYVEFEYVIGGVHDPSLSKRLKLSQASITTDYRGKNLPSINVTSDGGWILISNSGSGWLTASPTNGNGSNSVSLSVLANMKAEQRVGTLVFATTTRSNYEEAYFSVIQLPNVTPIAARFDGSSPNSIIYGPYYGWTAGTETNEENLTAIIKVKCTGSDWHVKSKPNFITLSKNGGKDGVVEQINVYCDPQEEQMSPFRSGNIVFVATDDNNITYSVKVQQLADAVHGNGMYINPDPQTITLEYGQSYRIGVYYCVDFTGPIACDNYRVVLISGDGSLVTLDKHDGFFNIINKNTGTTQDVVSLKIYNNRIDENDEYMMTRGVAVTLKPKVVVPEINITVTSTASTVEYYSSVSYGVTLSGTGEYREYGWHPKTSAFEGDVKVTRDSNSKFTVKNLNPGETMKEIDVWAEYDANLTTPIESNRVRLKLYAQDRGNVTGGLHIYSGYTAYVKFEIWPKNGDPAQAITIYGANSSGSQPAQVVSNWEPSVLLKDRDDTYCIRLTNPNFGYYPITHVTITNDIGKVSWQYGMQYDQIYEIEGRRLRFGNGFQIDIHVEP